MTDTWWQYVERITSGATQRAIAATIDVDKATVWRWKTGTAPSPEAVIRLARAYQRPIVEALVASGAITPEEADIRHVAVAPNLSELDDEELVDELLQRLRRKAR
ncbi:helix-turn-helix domain-containing protein [Streptosporangium sp. NPDC004631]